MRMKSLISTGLAASFVLFGASRADAAFQLALEQVGGPGFTVFATAGGDFTAVAGSGSFGDFTITNFSASSLNSATSDLLSASLRVTNNSTTEETLRLYVTQTNYTLPPGSPLSVESGQGGSI